MVPCLATARVFAGGRTARLVNPIAWENGVVFGQCGKCEVWHVLSAKNPTIFEEVRYKEDPRYMDPTASGTAEAFAAPDPEAETPQ